MHSNFIQITNWLGAALGIFFGVPGILKLVGNNLPFWRWARQSYQTMYPLWVYYFSGVVELIGGIGLLFPALRLYGAIMIMILVTCLAVPSLLKKNFKSVLLAMVSLVPLALLVFLSLHA